MAAKATNGKGFGCLRTRASRPEPVGLLSEVNPNPLAAFPESFPVTRGPMKSLRWGPYHYILSGDGSEELYDVTVDPFEQENLAGRPESAGVLAGLARELRRMVGPEAVAGDGRERPGPAGTGAVDRGEVERGT